MPYFDMKENMQCILYLHDSMINGKSVYLMVFSKLILVSVAKTHPKIPDKPVKTCRHTKKLLRSSEAGNVFLFFFSDWKQALINLKMGQINCGLFYRARTEGHFYHSLIYILHWAHHKWSNIRWIFCIYW